jgi:uncharacterized membrane protein YdbT with pleckstrin-like domain
MICRTCSTEVPDEALFCHRCGARLDILQDADSVRQTSDPDDDPGDADQAPAEKIRQKLSPQQQAEDDPERTLWKGRYSPKAMIGTWILAGVITILVLAGGFWLILQFHWPWGVSLTVLIGGLLVLWAALGLQLAYRMLSFRYELTAQRFVHQSGVLRRTTDRIETIDMDDITYDQKLIERFVGVGTIRITSSDRTHPELLLHGIEDVKNVANLIDDCRHKERRKRGLHIESV